MIPSLSSAINSSFVLKLHIIKEIRHLLNSTYPKKWSLLDFYRCIPNFKINFALTASANAFTVLIT